MLVDHAPCQRLWHILAGMMLAGMLHCHSEVMAKYWQCACCSSTEYQRVLVTATDDQSRAGYGHSL